MSNKCPTCSQSGVERSNPQGEARCSEPASRNASELDSASLHKVGLANLPDRTKPAIIGEATLVRSRWTPRGDWRQRVGKEKPRNLRGPAAGGKAGVDHRACRRESEGIVVVKKQGNSCGAKGSRCQRETIERSSSACLVRLRINAVSRRWNRKPKMMLAGEPDAGNPQVRFDEGEQRGWRKPPVALYSIGSTTVVG